MNVVVLFKKHIATTVLLVAAVSWLLLHGNHNAKNPETKTTTINPIEKIPVSAEKDRHLRAATKKKEHEKNRGLDLVASAISYKNIAVDRVPIVVLDDSAVSKNMIKTVTPASVEFEIKKVTPSPPVILDSKMSEKTRARSDDTQEKHAAYSETNTIHNSKSTSMMEFEAETETETDESKTHINNIMNDEEGNELRQSNSIIFKSGCVPTFPDTTVTLTAKPTSTNTTASPIPTSRSRRHHHQHLLAQLPQAFTVGNSASTSTSRRHLEALHRMLPWTKIGQDLDGEAKFDTSASLNQLAISSDGLIVAVGAFFNKLNATLTAVGHVKVYQLNATNMWELKGQELNGDAKDDYFGDSVALSADGNTLAVGATQQNGPPGYARIFEYDDTTNMWNPKGGDIPGEEAMDLFGSSIALSDEANIVAIGATFNDGGSGSSSDNRGHVKVYEFNGTDWEQLGGSLNGTAAGDEYGTSISLSSDGLTVAIGSHQNEDGGGDDAGHVRVFVYDMTSSTWNQKGMTLTGNTQEDFGHAVSLSSDGDTLAVGAPEFSLLSGGYAAVYQYNSTAWVAKGDIIPGEFSKDRFGYSVALSADGNTLAVGAIWHNGAAGSDSGHVRVFIYNMSGDWDQQVEIEGEAFEDNSGSSLALSASGSTVAIGARLNDGETGDTDDQRGHVRVYDGTPSNAPSFSYAPSSVPSVSPSASAIPSSIPSGRPSSIPTPMPSAIPSSSPSMRPSIMPSAQPISSEPSAMPSKPPISPSPSIMPSAQPISSEPSAMPSEPPISPSGCCLTFVANLARNARDGVLSLASKYWNQEFQ